LLFSCGNKKNINIYDSSFILGDNDYKVWLVQYDSIELPSSYYYYFDKDSNCITTHRNLRGKNSGTFKEFPLEDFILPNNWYFRNDTLFINEHPFDILKKVKDTIFLRCEGMDNSYISVYLIDIGIPPKSVRTK
jgi:hypothetical protein